MRAKEATPGTSRSETRPRELPRTYDPRCMCPRTMTNIPLRPPHRAPCPPFWLLFCSRNMKPLYTVCLPTRLCTRVSREHSSTELQCLKGARLSAACKHVLPAPAGASPQTIQVIATALQICAPLLKTSRKPGTMGTGVHKGQSAVPYKLACELRSSPHAQPARELPSEHGLARREGVRGAPWPAQIVQRVRPCFVCASYTTLAHTASTSLAAERDRHCQTHSLHAIQVDTRRSPASHQQCWQP